LEASVLDTTWWRRADVDTADAITTGDGAESRSGTSVNDFQLQIMATNGTVTT